MRDRNGKYTNIEKVRRVALAKYAKAFREGYAENSKPSRKLDSFSANGAEMLARIAPVTFAGIAHPAYGLAKGRAAGSAAKWAGVHLGDFE